MSAGDTYIAAELGLLGLAIGSFLNLVIDRLPRGESIVSGASHCEACNTRLGMVDLVPVLSYLWLRGRCRHCGARVPVKLLMVELFTGLVFAYIGYEYGLTVEAALLAIYSGFLVVIFMIDLERGLILNRVIFPATLLALALSFLRPDTISEGTIEVFWRSMAGGGIAFGTLLGIYLLARGGLGEGDVKLAAFVGLVSGFPVVVTTLLASFVGGGLVGVFLLTTRIRSRKQAVPFGPFLALSTLAHLLWGQDIYDWYIGLF